MHEGRAPIWDQAIIDPEKRMLLSQTAGDLRPRIDLVRSLWHSLSGNQCACLGDAIFSVSGRHPVRYKFAHEFDVSRLGFLAMKLDESSYVRLMEGFQQVLYCHPTAARELSAED